MLSFAFGFSGCCYLPVDCLQLLWGYAGDNRTFPVPAFTAATPALHHAAEARAALAAAGQAAAAEIDGPPLQVWPGPDISLIGPMHGYWTASKPGAPPMLWEGCYRARAPCPRLLRCWRHRPARPASAGPVCLTSVRLLLRRTGLKAACVCTERWCLAGPAKAARHCSVAPPLSAENAAFGADSVMTHSRWRLASCFSAPPQGRRTAVTQPSHSRHAACDADSAIGPLAGYREGPERGPRPRAVDGRARRGCGHRLFLAAPPPCSRG